jgi:hypothetical protein
MALLGLAALFAVISVYVAAVALRFRQGRAVGLRRRSQLDSLWPAARRRIAYALLPIAGLCLVTALSMAAQVAGLGGPVVSVVYLLLVLGLLGCAIAFMVRPPLWLDPNPPSWWDPTTPPDRTWATEPARTPDLEPGRPGTGTAGKPADLDPADRPPRPIAEMSPGELADWAGGDPEKLRRLIRRLER